MGEEELDLSIKEGPFQPSWESLRGYRTPEWFRDAKFGIWSHWGPQSVPKYGDWYARNMYREGEPQYLHHWRVYGHPSEVGYKEIVKQWKAEEFEPERLMKLFKEAGAQYFVAQAVHHDNFDNWDSRYHDWNSVQVGPGKDIVGAWRTAAEKYDLPFGVSEHLERVPQWFAVNKGCDEEGPYAGVPYDGNDSKYEDFYLPDWEEEKLWSWWGEVWFRRMKDLIDQHRPDLLYSDGARRFKEGIRCDNDLLLSIVAHLYNSKASSSEGMDRAVYTQKDTDPQVYRIGVLDIERGLQSEIDPRPWQTDTSVGNWSYHVSDSYKSPGQVIRTLVDIVSKNGNLLLNLPQLPDGSLDEECRYILDELATWFDVNGEGIYSTRPWEASGEGPTAREGGSFEEEALDWTEEDFRFTRKEDFLYAFQMKPPESKDKIRIKSLARGEAPEVLGVELLGKGSLLFEEKEEGLQIQLPEENPTDYVACFRIDLR